jgi:prepilin-type N-terminal cleavage/methylation domain-containing protein
MKDTVFPQTALVKIKPTFMRTLRQGFSLIELLAVMTIIIIMGAMSLPMLSSLSNQIGRKGAVNILLNSFEQARVTALNTGVTTYVGFADANFPQEHFRYRAFILFRERREEDPAQPPYVALTKWTFLPKGISFKSIGAQLLGDTGPANSMNFKASDGIPYITNNLPLRLIGFNGSGQLSYPSGANSSHLNLYIYEGFFSASSADRDNSTNKNNLYFERISFRRFTGRAELDITQIPVSAQ